MEKTYNYNFDALSQIGSNEDVTIRLGRLWATALKAYRSTTDLQHEFEQMNLDPYPGLTPQHAMSSFMIESKTYVRSKGPAKFFESQLRNHDIRINMDTVVIEDVTYTPVGGSLVPMNPIEVTARDCANVITMYTRVKGNDNAIITEAAEDKAYQTCGMPIIKAANIRRFLNNTTTDPIKARDEIYSKLSNKHDLILPILCTSLIYSNDKLADYRKSSPALLAKYKSLVEEKTKASIAARVKNPAIVVHKWPVLTDAYTLKQGPFRYITANSPENLWRFFMTSTNVRGGQKKIGAISRGYYRFDISPPLIAEIEEVTDLIMIVKKFNFKAVTLEVADVRLAMVLAYNGITVYCPALQPLAQKGEKVGVYSRGSLKSFIYRAITQEAPTLTKHSVTMPSAIPIYGTAPHFVMEYIPNVPEPSMAYLPSCRADQGLCIKTNIPTRMGVSLDSLRLRFSAAISYRNWFIFTRYTFVSQDIFRSWFNNSWVLPKIKEDLSEDFFKDGTAFSVLSLKDTVYEIDLTVTEQDSVPESPQVVGISSEELSESLDALNSYTREARLEFRRLVVEASLPVDHQLYNLYSFYDQEELVTMIDSIRDYDEEEGPVIQELEREVNVFHQDSEEDDVDLFAGGESRTVNALGVGKLPEKKLNDQEKVEIKQEKKQDNPAVVEKKKAGKKQQYIKKKKK